MKRFLVPLLVFSLFVTSALAGETFYNTNIGYWQVYGVAKSQEHNTVCVTKTTGPSSSFLLVQDMTNGEAYAELNNTDWKFEGDGTVIFVFKNKNDKKEQVLKGLFQKVHDTSIQMRNLNLDKFLPPFVEFDTLSILFRDGSSLDVGLENSRKSILLMDKCIGDAKKFEPDVIPADPPKTTIPKDPPADNGNPKINMTLPKVDS